MIRLRLVRHGEPAWIVDGLAVDDPELTASGVEEVEALCEELAGERFDALFVSPLRRALQTAEPLARRLGMEPRVCPWLAEQAPPVFEGRPGAEVDSAFEAVRGRPPAEWWDGMPGGESFRDFRRRVVGGLEGLLSGFGAASFDDDGYRLWRISDEDLSLLLVCHGGTSGVVVSHLLGLEAVPWEHDRFPLRTGGSAVLQTRPLACGEIWSLMRLEGAERLF